MNMLNNDKKAKLIAVGMIAIIFLLLIFSLKSCQEKETKKNIQTTQELKRAEISNICAVTKKNINDFTILLNSGNLCEDTWFKDVADYRERLVDQNVYIKERIDEENYKTIYDLHALLIENIKAFEKNPNQENLATLEESFKEYKERYDTTCQSQNVTKGNWEYEVKKDKANKENNHHRMRYDTTYECIQSYISSNGV